MADKRRSTTTRGRKPATKASAASAKGGRKPVAGARRATAPAPAAVDAPAPVKIDAEASARSRIEFAKQARPDLAAVRAQIDGIDREIQALIAERALWAHQVGKAKGKLAAAID